jgi:putative endonuclease
MSGSAQQPPSGGDARPHEPADDGLRRRLGALGEQLALEHLERLGWKLVERNYRTRAGEIDLIVHDDKTVVFVEVKTASARAGVRPFERLDALKRRRVRWIAAAWLRERRNRPRFDALRFDAVAVVVDSHEQLVAIEHLEGAF